MATPRPSLEERMHERRSGSPQAIVMFADLALGVALLLVTLAVWSPTTAPKLVELGLKITLPASAILLLLRAFIARTPSFR